MTIGKKPNKNAVADVELLIISPPITNDIITCILRIRLIDLNIFNNLRASNKISKCKKTRNPAP